MQLAETSQGKKNILQQKMKEYSARVSTLQSLSKSGSQKPKPQTSPDTVTAPPVPLEIQSLKF
jgi:hypothetical protein